MFLINARKFVDVYFCLVGYFFSLIIFHNLIDRTYSVISAMPVSINTIVPSPIATLVLNAPTGGIVGTGVDVGTGDGVKMGLGTGVGVGGRGVGVATKASTAQRSE
jgi:hypothetical protein